jgi:hypothetical protein
LFAKDHPVERPPRPPGKCRMESIATKLKRRKVVEGAFVGMGGLATAQLFHAAIATVEAAPADPGAGPLVTPNPIKAIIQKSGIRVELVDFARAPQSSASAAYARINFLYYASDSSGRVFFCDTRGALYVINGNTRALRLFLDLRKARGGAWYGANHFMGFRSFAFHPDFARPGRPGYGKLYTVNTEKPVGVPRFNGPYPAHHHDVVAEWSIDPVNPMRINPSSRREVLRIAQFGFQHNTDQLMFNPHSQPDTPGYGMMFIGVGDGGNFSTHPDPYEQAQNLRLAPGKILRINPLLQRDGKPYAVPGDNPFVGRANALPEIWALGLRHPQNLTFDRGGAGTLLIADIGQNQIEEINIGRSGANYGWPVREGTFVTDRRRVQDLYALPADDAARGFTYPVAQYDHTEGLAVTGGFVYRGSAVPALVGHYLFGDLRNGRIFHIPVSDLLSGQQATIRELTLLRGGREVTMQALVNSASGRVDLRFGQDQAGEVYITSKQDGWIRKFRVR